MQVQANYCTVPAFPSGLQEKDRLCCKKQVAVASLAALAGSKKQLLTESVRVAEQE